MTRASRTLIVCLITSVWPASTYGQTAASGDPAGASAQRAATRMPWRVTSRLVVRTGGGHLEQPKGFLVSDPAIGRVRFEGPPRDVFDVRYDRITSLHHEEEAKQGRLFNKDVEFYLVVRYADEAGGQQVSIVRLSEDDVTSTLQRLEADTGLRVARSEAKRSFLGLPIRVAVGDAVSITDVMGGKTKGRITALSESSLALAGPGGVARVYDEANVVKIRLRYNPRRDALVGFAVGTGTGGAVAALSCAAAGGCGADDLPAVLVLAAGVGGLTAGYAVALGAAVHPFNKSHEVYRGGGGARGTSAAVRVGPILTRQRRGAMVSVTF